MPKELETRWSRAIFRQELLEDGTPWLRYYADPVFRENMTDRGIGDLFQEWTQADKLAYAFLMKAMEEMKQSEAAKGRKVGRLRRPRALAKGFGLRYKPLDPEATALKTLGKFESLIRKRWRKKKEAERTKVLQKAWPDMPASHRPDLRCIIEGGKRPREVFLLPYINHEDLAQGNTLLRLLNSRGRHEPSVFAQVDLERVQLAIRSKKILQPYQLVVHKIDMSSSVLPPCAGYGYVTLPNRRDARDIITHREVAGSDGVLVLEVQTRLLNFLTDFCREILHDKHDEIDDERILNEPEPEPLPAHDETTDSIVWVALQAPYRTPHASIDLHGMIDLAKAAADDAQMRLWTLRQDPGYFATAVVDFAQHNFEYIQDIHHQHHADVDLPGKFFINKAVRRMVHEALRTALLWEVVASLLEQIVEQERRFVESGVRLEEDSPEYFDLLMGLRHTLDNMMLPDTMKRLAIVILTDPCYRDCLARPFPAKRWTINTLRARHTEFWTDWLARLAIRGYDSARPSGPSGRTVKMEEILVEMQRVMETEPRRKLALSEYAVTTIARAGLQADLRSQLTNFRPRVFAPSQGVGYERARAGAEGWAASNFEVQIKSAAVRALDRILGYALKKWVPRRENGDSKNSASNEEEEDNKEEEEEEDDEEEEEEDDEEDVDDKEYDDEEDTKFPNLGEYADPSDGKFKYPVRLTPTQETTKAMQRAEANLDIFWSEFDSALKEKNEGIWAEIQRISVPPQRARTADWVPPVPRARRMTQGAPSGSIGDIDSQLLQLSLSPRPGNKTLLLQEASQKKEKEKRRGTADPLRATQTQEAEQPANEPERQGRAVFRVDGRAMDVVETLFHQEGAHGRRNNVAWAHFVRLITSIGFAVSGLGGSMWRFTPLGEQLRQGLSREETRSVIFHQPHPGPDLPFYIARDIGRRLTEKYKLDASSFEER